MYLSQDCLACHNTHVRQDTGQLSSFVLSRILARPISAPWLCTVLRCDSCGFSHCQFRFTAEEQQRLYLNYRGPEYNRLRLEHEGNAYLPLIGNFSAPEAIEQRMRGIRALIERNIDINRIRWVLDYGGGRGDFIPASFIFAEKFVYDISGTAVAPGIQRYTGQRHIDWDFIQCCHCLEHVSEPDEFMRELLAQANTASYIYIEVPNNDAPRSGAVWHEHINSFTERSLTILLERHNLQVRDQHTLNGCIGMLATINRE